MRQGGRSRTDERQGEQHQAKADENTKDMASAPPVFVTDMSRNPDHQQGGRKPGQIKGQNLRHQCGTDIRADNNRQGRQKVDRMAFDKGNQKQCRRRGTLQKGRDRHAGKASDQAVFRAMIDDLPQGCPIGADKAELDHPRAP